MNVAAQSWTHGSRPHFPRSRAATNDSWSSQSSIERAPSHFVTPPPAPQTSAALPTDFQNLRQEYYDSFIEDLDSLLRTYQSLKQSFIDVICDWETIDSNSQSDMEQQWTTHLDSFRKRCAEDESRLRARDLALWTRAAQEVLPSCRQRAAQMMAECRSSAHAKRLHHGREIDRGVVRFGAAHHPPGSRILAGIFLQQANASIRGLPNVKLTPNDESQLSNLLDRSIVDDDDASTTFRFADISSPTTLRSSSGLNAGPPTTSNENFAVEIQCMKLPLHQLPGNSDPFTFVLRADIAFKEKFIGQLRGRLFGAVEQCIAQAAVFVRDGDQSFAAFIRALQGRAQTTMNASSRQSSHRNRLHLILEDDLSRVMGELGRVVVEHAHGLVELEERYRRVVASDLRTYPRSRDFEPAILLRLVKVKRYRPISRGMPNAERSPPPPVTTSLTRFDDAYRQARHQLKTQITEVERTLARKFRHEIHPSAELQRERAEKRHHAFAGELAQLQRTLEARKKEIFKLRQDEVRRNGQMYAGDQLMLFEDELRVTQQQFDAVVNHSLQSI